MRRHLLLRLDAPLMSFGSVMVDSYGFVGDIPVRSLVTGLIANALGWRRTDFSRLQRLQDRLCYAVRRDREGERFCDFQTAMLGHDDQSWTTYGVPVGREGGSETYKSPHIRRRWYDGDACVTVALRLDPAEESPVLEDVASSLDCPVRPLFLGRKCCLPSGRIVLGLVDAEDCLSALVLAPLSEDCVSRPRCFWPAGEGPENFAVHRFSGLRHWHLDVHAGEEVWFEGVMPSPQSGS